MEALDLTIMAAPNVTLLALLRRHVGGSLSEHQASLIAGTPVTRFQFDGNEIEEETERARVVLGELEALGVPIALAEIDMAGQATPIGRDAVEQVFASRREDRRRDEELRALGHR